MGKLWKMVGGRRVRTAAGIRHQMEKWDSTHKYKKARAARNKARRHAIAEGRVSKGDGKDLHHTEGTNSDKTRVMSASVNRGKIEKSRRRNSRRNRRRWGR